jgi:hypothetical protein
MAFCDFFQANVKSPQAKNLFTLLDERLKLPVFCDNMAASNTKVRPCFVEFWATVSMYCQNIIYLFIYNAKKGLCIKKTKSWGLRSSFSACYFFLSPVDFIIKSFFNVLGWIRTERVSLLQQYSLNSMERRLSRFDLVITGEKKKVSFREVKS